MPPYKNKSGTAAFQYKGIPGILSAASPIHNVGVFTAEQVLKYDDVSTKKMFNIWSRYKHL